MNIKCPKCGSGLETGKRPVGSNIVCGCGNVVAVPRKSGFPTWLIIGLVGVAGCVPCTGILAGIAIPNFLKFQARSKQTECKVNLKALYAAQQAYFDEKKAYAPELADVGFSPEPGNRYAYLTSLEGRFVDRATAARESMAPLDEATVRAAVENLGVGIEGECPECALTAACVGNIDGDETLDVWTVSSLVRTTSDGQQVPPGTPFQHVDDVVE